MLVRNDFILISLNIAFFTENKNNIEIVSDRHMIVWIRCVFISIVWGGVRT